MSVVLSVYGTRNIIPLTAIYVAPRVKHRPTKNSEKDLLISLSKKQSVINIYN